MNNGGGTLLRLGRWVGTVIRGPLCGSVALAMTLAGPEPLAAQDGWNDDRALDLVRRARAVRQTTITEQGLQSYAADARGYVYFFVDQEGTEERSLVRTDQVALEVYWQAPNRTRQRIVGLRDEEQLPTNINYHLDHLTVVQDNFDDRIRLGDDDEVSAVVHPLAPGSETTYDFALGDSLTIQFAGLDEPIRVFEIRVRPVDVSEPGFVGSVFVDRGTAGVVRMRFTFTPASYVDGYLDYIRISLDNALWDGRYWLPHQQMVELRREVPFLDFPMGSVIRARYEISGYRLNEPLADLLFVGPRITAEPEARRRAFPFEEDLYAQIDAEGLGPAPDLDEIQDQAAELVRNQYLGGTGPVRLYIPDVSSVLRYNRAEGTVVGAGVSYRPSGSVGFRLAAGYGFGRKEALGRLVADGGERRPETRLAAYVNEPRDIGPVQAASGAVNTLASLLVERDFQDLFFVSGLRASQGIQAGEVSLEFGARWEQQRSAQDVISDESSDFRPVLPALEGDLVLLDVGATWERANSGLGAQASVDLATFEGETFGVLKVGADWTRERLQGRRTLVQVRAEGGVNAGSPPPQHRFLLGGRGTLPGYDFRSWLGDSFWLARADGRVALWWPWVSGRVFAAAGGTSQRLDVPDGWTLDDSDGARGSAGVGLDLLWDVVRLEAGRGLNGGDWEFNFFASKRFWPIL